MLKIKLFLVGLMCFGIIACGSDEVSWSTQEQQRALAIENSDYNAKAYRTKNKQYSGYGIYNRGDSSIGSKCANGDGWSSVDLKSADQKQVVKLKCSTASGTIGCLTASDFAGKVYANEDGTCNKNLPVPMPKIVK